MMFTHRPVWIVPAAGLGLWAAPVMAGTLELAALRPLDFGAIVVLGNGSKQIAPDGSVTSSGLTTVSGQREGPAEFTLTYRPDRQIRVATVMVSVATIGNLTRNGSVGSLGSLATDFPGLGTIRLGETRVVNLPPCPPPQCETAFRIGGQLTLTGGTQQATFSFPLQVTARLLAER